MTKLIVFFITIKSLDHYLIFVPFGMPEIVALESFYKTIRKISGPGMSEPGHFNLFKIEDIFLPKRRRATYSRRSFYKVTLITGHNKLHYGEQFTEINGSALIFSNPTIPYYWDTISEKQSGYMCVFTESFFSRFENIRDYPVFLFPEASVIPLNKKQLAHYTALFSKMHAELQGDYLHKYALLRNLLMEVIHEAQKIHPSERKPWAGSNASERIAALFAELLERQFPIELNYQVMKLNSPSAFAEHLHIHVNHLNKALKEITGQTTSQLIKSRILQEAYVLLKSTNWTIAEIAFSLGFEEPNHFSGFFKSNTKMTAKQYRQQHLD